MKQESIHGEELKTEIISMVKNLKQEHISGEAKISMVKNLTQKSTHGTELILNCTHGAELQQRRQDAR